MVKQILLRQHAAQKISHILNANTASHILKVNRRDSLTISTKTKVSYLGITVDKGAIGSLLQRFIKRRAKLFKRAFCHFTELVGAGSQMPVTALGP